jgi:hypothetical protein
MFRVMERKRVSEDRDERMERRTETARQIDR